MRIRHTRLSWILWVIAALLSPAVVLAQTVAPAAIVGTTAPQIVGLESPQGELSGSSGTTSRSVGLNSELFVKLSGRIADASQYVLFLNGRELKGIPAAVYANNCGCLDFHLARSTANSDLWASLLGSPTHLTVPVTVSLGMRPSGDRSEAQATIFATTRDSGTFNLEVISLLRLGFAIGAVMVVVIVVWLHADKSTTLRDNYLPQIAPGKQTYSLARWQMAFWFTLVFASFLFLFLLLWDFNTISPQALALLGISGGTAAGAIAIDIAKDSPADAVNRGLQALGLYTYTDVLHVRDEINAMQMQLKALMAAPSPPAQQTVGLQTQIQDRLNILRTYEDKTGPFETQGWFKDITTDLNGTSLHRLQAFLWTWVLGAVFVIGVYRNLAMPEFGPALLALMGISSAGYVGFKMQEQNT